MYLQFYTAAQHDSFPVDAMQMLISGSEISSMTCSIINNCYSDIITISGYFLFTPVYNTVISTFIIVFSKYICSLHHVIERGKHCLCWWIQTHDVFLVGDIIFNPLLILFLKIFYYYLFFIYSYFTALYQTYELYFKHWIYTVMMCLFGGAVAGVQIVPSSLPPTWTGKTCQ